MPSTTSKGQVLLGYGYWHDQFNCPQCGNGYFMIEAGPIDEDYHLIRCWCGATAHYLKQDFERDLLGSDVNPSAVKCPGCELQLERDDLQAQMRHMELEHPDIIADRRRKAPS